jgi:hypothetical protein
MALACEHLQEPSMPLLSALLFDAGFPFQLGLEEEILLIAFLLPG